LLTRFLSRRDEDALAALVRRHAPMVWGVCCRVLGNPQDAEDAFQATFLVLVQKAVTVVPTEMVANWLHGVARQTAVRLRAMAARRGWREVQMSEMPEPAVAETHDGELLSMLDQELCRLPERFRALVVLCDLEGHTRGEAARQLGCPEGSVASGLARARALLAKRLTQRGVVLSAGSMAAALSAGSTPASPALVATTVKAASLLAAGKSAAAGAIPVKVAALSDGVIKAMFMTKLKSAIAVVLVLGAMGAGGTSLAHRVAAGQDNKALGADDPTGRVAAVRDGKEPGAEKPREDDKPPSKDLGKVEPPGGVPLPLVGPGTKKIGVDQLNKVRERLRSVPEKALEQWVVELERITDVKLKDGLPSPRQACRTDFAVRMSVAFDDLRWNAAAADNLYKRARAMRPAEAKAWKEAFEALLGEKIGIEQAGKDEFSYSAGGPPWGVPLVLIPVDALHEGQKYSAERGKKYLARLKQLTKDDVGLWRQKVDKFGGTELDAAVNIILLDEFFSKEEYQRDKFKAAVEARDPKPAAKDRGQREEGKESVTAWGEGVDGVQLGIQLGGRRPYQVGEDVTVLLRIRNTGKERLPYRESAEYFYKNPPLVTGPDGKAVPIKAMTVWGFLRQRFVEPGNEVDLANLTLALRPATDRANEAAWTLYGTGRFQIRYSLKDAVGEVRLGSPGTTLTSGKQELEIKEPGQGNLDKGRDASTAWGQEVGGLQAGLAYPAGQGRSYRPGETVTLVVRVRNVGKGAVDFKYCRESLDENPPAVRDRTGKPLPLRGRRVWGFHALRDVKLAPGEEVDLHELKLELRAVGDRSEDGPWILYEAGKVQIQFERVIQTGEIKYDAALSKLATGTLELEVKESATE
jgi:RNA polymerase sigma factor (sigma-70 family)